MFLAADRQTELARVSFFNVGIYQVSSCPGRGRMGLPWYKPACTATGWSSSTANCWRRALSAYPESKFLCLKNPIFEDQLILSRLQDEYGLQVSRLTFLPLGADVNTAVYRLETEDASAYFLKLRKGDFDEITVAVPQFLSEQGIRAIIAPLPAKSHQLYASLGAFKLILYPFIEGQNGYEVCTVGSPVAGFRRSAQRHPRRSSAAWARRAHPARDLFPARARAG